MVAHLDQFLELRARFTEAVSDLRGARVLHGVMLEVPSACLQAREILEVADFASVGTNDLLQYLFAVDRNNELVAQDYPTKSPILWSLLGQIAQAARDKRRPLSVCGEVASDPDNLAKLLHMGFETVSVNPRLIGDVRKEARRILTKQSRQMQSPAASVQSSQDSDAAR